MSLYNVIFTHFQDVVSAGLLDITSNISAKWFRNQLKAVIQNAHVGDPNDFLSNQDNDILFYLDTGNTFHTPTFYQFAVPLNNPDLYREYFIDNVMDDVGVIGVSGASSK